ncbi:MAG: hypothetical protein V4604_09790 [Bacteroidota bacterium]
MKKQPAVYLLSWIGIILYVISLFLPYRVEGSFSNKHYISGIEFGFPLANLLLILPMTLIIQLSKKTVGRAWNLAFGILHLLYCFFCFFASVFSLWANVEPGIGVFLLQLTGILFVIAVSIHLSMPEERSAANHESDLLDDF